MKQSRFILFVLSFLMMSIGNVYAQNIIVTGTVLDSTGEPVIGANVKVAGNSSVGTITDFEGISPCRFLRTQRNWKSVISVCFHKRLSLSREPR